MVSSSRASQDDASRRWQRKLPLSLQCRQIERVTAAEPKRRVSVIAQFVVGVRMNEDVERAVVQRQPAHDVGELRRRERQLIAPARVRADVAFVKASHLDPRAEPLDDALAQCTRGVASRFIEIDVGVPAVYIRNVELRHGET